MARGRVFRPPHAGIFDEGCGSRNVKAPRNCAETAHPKAGKINRFPGAPVSMFRE